MKERDDTIVVAAKFRWPHIWIHALESAEARRLYLDLCGLFVEPLRFPGRYRFGDSDLTRRVRDRGFEALIENPLPQPPPEILFIHRKPIGSFLLCAHIGASVDCRPLYRELVAGA